MTIKVGDKLPSVTFKSLGSDRMEEVTTEKLLSADEAAEVTGLHPTTIRRLAWQRRIRSFKVLSALRFKRSDLEELIIERPAKNQVGSTAA